jgi:leucyl-tRNA synthetase
MVVQINGKTRDTIMIEATNVSSQETVEQLVKQSEKIAKYLDGVSVKKVIFVPSKIINFVI